MSKKISLVLILSVFAAGGAFAQFWIEGAVTSDINSVTPTIGIGYGFKKIDIMAGIGLGLWTRNTKPKDNPATPKIRISYDGIFIEENNDESKGSFTDGGHNIVLYTGVAPKVSFNEKWTLSFPLLVQFLYDGIRQTSWKNSAFFNAVIGNAGNNSFTLGFLAGARASYALTGHWNLFTGFAISVFSWTQYRENTFSMIAHKIINTWNVFNTGYVQLGVSYTF